LWGVGISWAVYYYCYIWLQEKMKKWKREGLTGVDVFLTGLAATIVTTLLTNPIWVVNTRARLDQGPGRHPWEALRSIITTDGVKGLWAGVIPALILAPNPAMQFALYETLKRMLKEFKRSSDKVNALSGLVFPTRANQIHSLPPGPSLNSAEHFVIGMISKLVPILLTYPYQVVKSRAQLKASHVHQGILRSLFKILRSEGLGGLYKGLPAKMVASTLAAAVMFMTYEKILATLVHGVTLMRGFRHPSNLLKAPSSGPYNPPLRPVQISNVNSVFHPYDDEQWYKLNL